MLDVYEGKVKLAQQDGVFAVQGPVKYSLRSDWLLTKTSVVSPHPVDEHLGELWFRNYVGLAEVEGVRFVVGSAKLSAEAFDLMLDQVVSEVPALAFHYNTPTALSQQRDLSTLHDVPYHTLAYLRWAMLRSATTMHSQFLQMAHNPHRQVITTSQWCPTWEVPSLAPCGLHAVFSHPERLTSLPSASSLDQRGLGRTLNGKFPVEVLSSRKKSTFDTHENRLVRHTLALCAELVRFFTSENRINASLDDELRSMGEQLAWMQQYDFLHEVGPLTHVPFSSNVMQRQDGYREFLAHFINLHLSSALTDDRDLWQRLLELKDCAVLYELWTFFVVKRALDRMLGNATTIDLCATDDYQRWVPWAARATYQGDAIELTYNQSYTRGKGSYSLGLRPDIVIQATGRRKPTRLVFDAKFKFDWSSGDVDSEPDEEDWTRHPTRADLCKMHTYRDALTNAEGAFVLYPGSQTVHYPLTEGGPRFSGVGAIPLHPDREPTVLEEVLLAYLRWAE